MQRLSDLSDRELLAQLPVVRAAERHAAAKMIACLAEIDRRRLYLGEGCSSLFAFCIERLGYSENEAQKRIQVARLYQRVPRVLAELENGSIHLTGLFLLSTHLTDDNAAGLLQEARGRTRREIEAIIARRFPRPDVLPSITPLHSAAHDMAFTIPGNGSPTTGTASVTGNSLPDVSWAGAGGNGSPVSSAGAPRLLDIPTSSRLQPLSAASYRVEFTASAELRGKIEQARNMLGHVIPTGDLARLFERALDALLRVESKRRLGTGRPRRPRKLQVGSRHVPVEVARAVWERDGFQCTYTDAEGRRCGERRFLTIEHREPFARGGPATLDNLCLFCSAHNPEQARQEFGAAHVEEKRREAAAHAKTLSALVGLGFERRDAKAALGTLRQRGTKPEVEQLLREALGVLTL